MQFVEYKRVERLYLKIIPSGSSRYYRWHGIFYKARIWKGKSLCINDQDPCAMSRWHVLDGITPQSHPIVFVSPDSSMPRDLLRNSGYQITRDPNKAHCTIIPQLFDSYSGTADIIAVCDDQCVIVDMASTSKSYWVWTSDMIEELKERICEFQGWSMFTTKFIHDFNFGKLKYYFCPKAKEIHELAEDADDGRMRLAYCVDTNVKLVPSLQIGPELFDTWDHCKDKDLLYKSVLQTNWQDYPFTLAYYLYTYKYDTFASAQNGAVKMLLEDIGFRDLETHGVSSTIIIQPDDWNLLQKCILHKMGLGEEGGYAKASTTYSLLQTRLAVRPLYIDKPSQYVELVKMTRL